MSFLGVSLGYTAAARDTGYYKQHIFSSRCFEDSLGIHLFLKHGWVFISHRKENMLTSITRMVNGRWEGTGANQLRLVWQRSVHFVSVCFD